MPSRSLSLLCTLATMLLATLAGGVASASATDFRGVQLHSLWGDSTNADMDRQLDMTRDMGANVVRIDVGWQTLEENGKGVYSQWYVDKLDRFMAGASDRGIKVILTLGWTPCWASSAPDSLKQNCASGWWDRGVNLYAPSRASDYGDISRWVTARYGSKLAALELWNEPNLPDFLRAADPAAAYAPLVKAGYVGAKQGDASVPVLAGSLARADAPFLTRLYDQGIKGFYDGISIHPYNEQRDPAAVIDAKWAQYTFQAGTQLVHDTQLAHGDSTPIWATEFGWSTCAGGSNWCVSEAVQAAYTPKAFRLLANMPYVKAGIVYNLRDKGTDPVGIESNYGLLKRDYTPKPAYAALKALFTAPASASPTAPSAPVSSPTAPAPVHVAKGRPVTKASAPPRRRVHVQFARWWGKEFASGRAPAGALVRITVRRVRRVHGRTYRWVRHLHARADASGRFLRRVGRLNRPGRYFVRATIAG